MRKIKIIIATIAISTLFCLNAFAGEWKSDNTGWWYQNDNGSYSVSSWQEVNGEWYYFNEGGYMVSNTITPDGYTVNESGEWVQSKEASGSELTGKKYTFDSKGKWVSENKIPEGEYVYYPSEQYKNVVVKGSLSSMSNFNYIRLYQNDVINTGTYVPVAEAGEFDITKEGVFLVGRDIKAGTYKLTRLKSIDSRAECRVFTSIPSSKDESTPQKNMDQDFFVGDMINNTVTVQDGQYVQIIECTAGFIRP